MKLRLLVVEFITGGGIPAQDPLPPSLADEGDIMLRALLRDLAAIPAVEVLTTRDARLPGLDRARRVEGGEPAWRAWADLARTADALWPIAPETGGALERLSRLAPAGCRLLNSSPEAVAVAALKSATATRLGAAGIAVAPTCSPFRPPPGRGPWVAKPDDGAGCEDTVLLPDHDAWERWLAGGDRRGFVLQPYVAGPPASLSLICRGGAAQLLSVNRQDIRIEDGRFAHHGGRVAGIPATEAHHRLASGVAGALPGLRGYVGVDFIDTPAGPVVIEVNPRLTTSYAGLSQATGLNVAALVLDHQPMEAA